MTDWTVEAGRRPIPGTKPAVANEYAVLTDAELAAKVREHAQSVPMPIYGMWTPPGAKLLEEVAKRLERA